MKHSKEGANIYIEFLLYSDTIMHFHEISEIIGIKPTTCAAKGDEIRPNLFYKESFWEYKTPKIYVSCLDEVILRLRTILEPNLDALCEYIKKKKLNCKFGMVVESELRLFPSLLMSADFIRLCYRLNAEVDGDFYYLGSD